jgi:transposase-like protein
MQRCWVHKTANVLNKLPKSQQPKAKRALQEIWMAETKKDALAAFDSHFPGLRWMPAHRPRSGKNSTGFSRN